MKRKILVLAAMSALLSSYAQDEYKIIFSYDSAGNQTSRSMVCVNCKSDIEKVNDSTQVVAIAEKDDILNDNSEASETTAIYAYPNPVTNVMRVEWLASDNEVQNVALFSWSGQQLISSGILPAQLTVDLSFSQYPPGVYIVVLLYTDNTRKSFQVIKK